MYDNMKIGMVDCNDRHIKCGDVYENVFGERYCVYFINGAFCGGKSPDDCSPIGWMVDDDGFDLVGDNWTHDIKVIGNIYDNPELMNDE